MNKSAEKIYNFLNLSVNYLIYPWFTRYTSGKIRVLHGKFQAKVSIKDTIFHNSLLLAIPTIDLFNYIDLLWYIAVIWTYRTAVARTDRGSWASLNRDIFIISRRWILEDTNIIPVLWDLNTSSKSISIDQFVLWNGNGSPLNFGLQVISNNCFSKKALFRIICRFTWKKRE